MSPAAPKRPDAVPVLVDTDLAPDDLAALALLVRHPGVDVVAITVPGPDSCGCVGRGLVADLFEGLGTPPPPLACGDTSRGPDGVAFPQAWTMGAIERSGLAGDHDPTSLTPVAGRRRRAHRPDGPAPRPPPGRRARPADRARCRAAPAPVGVRPARRHHHDGRRRRAARRTPTVSPSGTPAPIPCPSPRSSRVRCRSRSCPTTRCREVRPTAWPGPVVGGLGRVPGFESPAYWDLATAGALRGPVGGDDRVGHLVRRHAPVTAVACGVRATGRCGSSPPSMPQPSTRCTAASSD